MSKKVFVCEYHEESNSFNPVITEKQDFYTRDISGAGSFSAMKNTISVAGGVADSLGDDYAFCGSVNMRVRSGGPVSDESVNWFLSQTIPAIEREKPDGVIINLHGATISPSSDDVCGDLIEAIRRTVGDNVFIGATFDLHANITEKTMKNADYICGYQTYPHVDFHSTGYRAGEIMKQLLSGKKLHAAYTRIPMMAPAHAYTTGTGNLKVLMDKAQKLKDEGRVTDYTIFQVQPWLDIPAVSSVITVVGDNEQEMKNILADLAKDEFALRKELQGEEQMSVKQVIEAALENKTKKPVVLGDAADSPNAGATGDCADIIGELLPYSDRLAAAVCVTDKPAVEKIFAAGVGAVIDIELGGTIAPYLSQKVTVKGARVKSLHMGEFILDYPHFQGIDAIGRTAVLKVGKMHILVAENGHGGGNLEFYGGFGINPRLCDLVCVKACTSFRAGYGPIAAKIYTPYTPGAAGTVLTKLPFKRLPETLYPFSEITEADIVPAKIYR